MRGEAPYLLGIDAGTMYIKSVLFDVEGEEAAIYGKEVEVRYPKPGWAEQNMMELWSATAETVKGVMRKAGISGEEIAAVCPTGQGHGSFLITREGKPAREHAMIWLDTRKQDIMDEWYKGWKEKGIAAEIYEVSGWRLIFSMQVLHMAWLARNEPEVLERAYAHLECKDWLRYKLTGEAYMDVTAASVTGLYNTAKLKWEDGLFEKLNIPREIFPEVLGSWEIAGEVTREAAEETGLREGTPVAAGAVDICSSALGAGAVNPGICCSIIGTAGIHELCVDKPIYDVNKEYSVACAAAPNRWYLEAIAVTAGSCLRWFRDTLGYEEIKKGEMEGIDPYEIYNRYVREAPLGANGILFHPFFSGERSPIVKPNARGTFFGLGLWTEKRDLIRAIYEGIGFATKDNIRLFEEAGIKPDLIRLVGGGARSEEWCQIISDITGYSVQVPFGEEFGAKGCAIEAGVVAGFYRDPFDGVERTVKIARRYEPDESRNKKYLKLFGAYRRLYQDLWDFYELHHKIMEEIS
jgi:sugar (pentulose or hexulose) kinase